MGGRILKCPKCNSIDVEIIDGPTVRKANWGILIGKGSFTKKVRQQQGHCKKCGYLWPQRLASKNKIKKAAV